MVDLYPTAMERGITVDNFRLELNDIQYSMFLHPDKLPREEFYKGTGILIDTEKVIC